jgi:hypothetical protein
MGLLQLLGLGGRGGERHLVVITFEGPGRLRLNANRTSGKRARQGAIAHEQTIGWIEFAPDGGRLDQGLGPAAGKLAPAELTALLRDLPSDPACKSVLRGLGSGRDHSSKVLSFDQWGKFGVGGGPAPEGGSKSG